MSVTPSAMSSCSHCRVLIIEDDFDSADSLREALEFFGHEVAVASNALEGISKAREFQPDAVICDIALPGSDGYFVARILRADDSLRNASLVAVTGYGEPADIEQARLAGFTHHFTKPLSTGPFQLLLRDLHRRDSA